MRMEMDYMTDLTNESRYAKPAHLVGLGACLHLKSVNFTETFIIPLLSVLQIVMYL